MTEPMWFTFSARIYCTPEQAGRLAGDPLAILGAFRTLVAAPPSEHIYLDDLALLTDDGDIIVAIRSEASLRDDAT